LVQALPNFVFGRYLRDRDIERVLEPPPVLEDDLIDVPGKQTKFDLVVREVFLDSTSGDVRIANRADK
jgi:hypothetical protein